MLSKLFVILFIVVCIDNVAGQGIVIKGVGSGRCIAVDGSSTANGAKDVTWDCYPSASNFQWFNILRSPYIYQLKNLSDKNVMKCMAVAGESVQDGAEIVQWDCLETANFLWQFKEKGYRRYQIIGVQSNKCLAVDGNYQGNGGKLVLWTCSEDPNFLWDVTYL